MHIHYKDKVRFAGPKVKEEEAREFQEKTGKDLKLVCEQVEEYGRAKQLVLIGRAKQLVFSTVSKIPIEIIKN
jgi:hypothetical protein